jgi:hypothetical protein
LKKNYLSHGKKSPDSLDFESIGQGSCTAGRSNTKFAFKMIPFQANERGGTAFIRTPTGYGHGLRARPTGWRSAIVTSHFL